MIDVAFINRVPVIARIPRAKIYQTLRRAERVYGKRLAGKQVSIVFVSPEEIKTLNSAYRKKDKATNVLSFTNSDNNDLGDIIICPAIATIEAKGAEQSFAEYVNFLFVHGLLHLLGFDHNNNAATMAMEQAEKELI